MGVEKRKKKVFFYSEEKDKKQQQQHDKVKHYIYETEWKKSHDLLKFLRSNVIKTYLFCHIKIVLYDYLYIYVFHFG